MKNRRKNYFPTLILITVLWGLLGAMIYFVEPEMVRNILIPGLYLPFFLLFLPAVYLSLAIIFGNSQRGLIFALGATALLILKVYRLDNWLNLVLILGIVVMVDRYFSV